MKRSTKLTLSLTALAILLLIVAAVVIGGFTFYRYYARNLQAEKDGVEFGKTTDSRGCVDESVRRFAEYKETSVLIRLEQFQIGHFTTGCLTTSRATPEFCKGVPGAGFLERLQWTTEQCRKAGLRDGGPCNEIYKAVIVHCSRK